MKKIFTLLVAFMVTVGSAQTIQSFKTIKLTGTTAGGTNDSVLTIGTDNIIKKVAKSSIQTDISGKENTIAPGTTSQYWRGDKTWQTLPTYTLSGLGGEPSITAGTTSQYWRGDKTWQTLPTYTLSGLGGQPLDADLTAIGGLTGTSGFLKKTAADTWALDTNSYLTGITSGNVTTALGYTPYNSSNPAGYITGITFAGVTAKPTTLSGYGITDAQPLITAGTTSQYWRGDKTWQTLPTYTLSGLGGVPTARIITINGTSYDLSADRSWSISAGAGTVTSVSGTGSVSGLTLSGLVTSSGSLTLGGALSLTSANVTGALGYTPYNSTNPNGYITASGRAFPKRADGANVNFNLSGTISTSATGTTTILGTENGIDVSNYSPSSLSVGYAVNAGNLSNMNISQFTNNSGYITGISSGNVTSALGYTPYNSSNPSGYITSSALNNYLPLSGGTVSGSITATAFYASSDKRLKNIIARDGDMIQYTWKDKRDTKVHYGYVAQEVKKEMPNQVNKDDNGYLSVNYIEVLVAKVNALEKEVKRLNAKLK